MKSKAVRIAAHGAADVLKLETVDVADPGPNEVLIRHTAIGLNYQDIYQRSGFYQLPMPAGLGTEGAGVAEKVGANVKDIKAGDRVCYAGGAPGSYAEYRLFPADRVIKTPANVTDEQAAAVLLKGMTAEYLLNRCYPVHAGEFVLFHAAAGGVGLVAGQWGKHLGAKMIGIAGGAEKVKLALANGYAYCIDRNSEDVVAKVKEITGGKGVPVVYDSVGKNSFDQSLHALAPRGYFVSFGTTTGAPPPVEAGALQKGGSLYFTRPTLVTYTASTEDLRASAKALFGLLGSGAIKVSVNQKYPLADIVKAHQDLESGKTSGSTIIVP